MREISKYVGKWGRYHTLLHVISFVASALSGIQSLVYSFTTANPQLRCMYDGEYNNASYSQVYGMNDSEWKRLYEHEDQGGYDIYCKYCPDMVHNGIVSTGSCGDNFTARDCKSIIYNTEHGAWKQELVKSLFMVGIFFGSAVWGIMADRYTVMEYSGAKARSASGMIFQAYFSIGYLLTGLLAYFIRDWKMLMWACSVPNVLYIVSIIYVPESYSWLATKGKVKEARKEIDRVCRINRIEIPKDVLDKELHEAAATSEKKEPQATVFDLFKHWKLAKNTLIVFYTWFAVTMVYFGVALNASDLPGDTYTNFELMGAVEIPAYLITIPFMNHVGRVPCLYGLMSLGGIALIISGFLPSSLPWYATTICALIGKMGIAAAFSVIYNYSAEMFPTVVRTAGTGFSSICARVGSIAAPQIHLLGVYVAPWLPLVIYGAFAFSAGFLDFFLPETMNRPMPQTIEDGIHFSDKNYFEMKSNEQVDDESEQTNTF